MPPLAVFRPKDEDSTHVVGWGRRDTRRNVCAGKAEPGGCNGQRGTVKGDLLTKTGNADRDRNRQPAVEGLRLPPQTDATLIALVDEDLPQTKGSANHQGIIMQGQGAAKIGERATVLAHQFFDLTPVVSAALIARKKVDGAGSSVGVAHRHGVTVNGNTPAKGLERYAVAACERLDEGESSRVGGVAAVDVGNALLRGTVHSCPRRADNQNVAVGGQGIAKVI